MLSLYSRLFKYRERPARSPREDFLSEALADLLMRIPSAERAKIITNLFVPSRLIEPWQKMKLDDAITVSTQRRLGLEGIADIVISADDEPLIVVENKIGSPVHDDQLHRYTHWLENQRKKYKQWPGVICLLTFLTPIPEDFFELSPSVESHVCNWTKIGTWLKREANTSLETRWKPLCVDFFTFLREEGMTSEFAGLEDFASAIAYIRSSDKMNFTYNSIYNEIKNLGVIFQYTQSRRATREDQSNVAWSSEKNVIWGWLYLNTTLTEGNAYLAYGIAINPSNTYPNAQPPIPQGNFVFLTVGWNNSFPKEKILALKLNSNWHIEDNDWIITQFRPLSEFLSEPDQFAKKMLAWITDRKPDIEMIATVSQSPKKLD